MHHQTGFGSQVEVVLAVRSEGCLVVFVLGVRIGVEDPDITLGDQVAQGGAEFLVGKGAGAFQVRVGRHKIELVHDGKFILSHGYG